MKMEPTHYLPHEVLVGTNFPEVIQLKTEIQLIQVFAMQADRAMYEYTVHNVDRIDLDSVEIQQAIDRCRHVTSILGNAGNVCYDILMDIRILQLNFQDLLFMKKHFGSEYIGTPTPSSEE